MSAVSARQFCSSHTASTAHRMAMMMVRRAVLVFIYTATSAYGGNFFLPSVREARHACEWYRHHVYAAEYQPMHL